LNILNPCQSLTPNYVCIDGYFATCEISVYAKRNSDIDLAVIPSHVKLEIQEELENLPILYKIDFIDFNEVDDDFKKVAK
jgi:hypothetical protein